MVRMNRPFVKLCRRKQIHAGFAVAPQTTKVMATVCGKCLVKMKKALNLHNKVCCYNSYILSLRKITYKHTFSRLGQHHID